MALNKVLQVIGGGEIGGAENHLLNLMRLLAGSEYDPILVCLCEGPFAKQAADYGIPAYTISMAHHFDISKIKDIQHLIRNNGISLVHTHGVRANLVARKAAYNCRVPVVTTFHSSLHHDYNNQLAALIAGLVTRMTNKYTDRFIAVSMAIKNYMLTLGIPEDQIDVIYNGIALDAPHNIGIRSELRSRLGIPDNAVVVGTVGRLHPVKGQVYLLEAAAQLLEKYSNLYLVIVGDGSEASHIADKVAQLNLTERVIMPGYCQDVFDFYALMDVFCLPSLMEGQGLVLLEAMMMGIPIVATRVGGVPEVITDKVNGLLVPPANAQALAQAVDQILSQPGLKNQLVANSAENLARFSLDNMASQTCSVYNAVLTKYYHS